MLALFELFGFSSNLALVTLALLELSDLLLNLALDTLALLELLVIDGR